MANPSILNPNQDNKFLYGLDAGLIMTTAQPPDSPPITTDENNDRISVSSDSTSSGSVMRGLASGFRALSESMMRMEIAELEMIKAREASRLEAEKQRAQVDTETVGMLLQTQLQIATFLLPKKSIHRKRKRVDSTTSQRKAALILSFIQCNLML